MTFKKGHTKSIGNKGGGRLSRKDEELRELAVQKAIGKTVKVMTNLDGVTDKQVQRVKDICLPIVVKDLTNKIGNPDGSKIEQVLVKFIDGNN